jgi:hypothetical protein
MVSDLRRGMSVTATAGQGGVLRHDMAFPYQLADGYLLVEVQGVNAQGGFAYGNTFLESTTDAGCLSQAGQAGAVPGFVPLTHSDSGDTGDGSAAANGQDGAATAREPGPGALETTGASNLSVMVYSVVLLAAGLALLGLRRGRIGGLSRREGLHTRPTGQ